MLKVVEVRKSQANRVFQCELRNLFQERFGCRSPVFL
jgi:hypothetical protein